MTRTTPILLCLSLFVGGLLLASAQDPATGDQPPASKKTPPATEKTLPKTEKTGPNKTDKSKVSPDGSKAPIPPNEMVKRFGGGEKGLRPRFAPPLAIQNATIHTMSDARTFVGTVVIREGKIAAVGKNVEIPADVKERIDAKGLTLTPGLIDARSAYGLATNDARASASDASLDILDGVDPTTEDYKELLREGVTAVYIQPASNGTLGGKGAVLRVAPPIPGRFGTSIDAGDFTVRAGSAVQASINASPTAGNTLSRSGQYESLKRSFEEAKKYDEEWNKYREEVRKKAEDAKKAAEAKAQGKDDKKTEPKKEEKKVEKKEEKKEEKKDQKPETPEEIARKAFPNWDQMPDQFKQRILDGIKRRIEAGQPPLPTFPQGQGGGFGGNRGTRGGPAAVGGPRKPKVDPAKELLLRVLKKEVPLRLETHREDDVRNAYKLADEFKIRLILEGLNEVRGAQTEIKDRHTPLVLGPFLDLTDIQSAASDSPLEQLRRRLPPGLQLPPGFFGAISQAAPARKWDRDGNWPKGMLSADTKFAIATFGSEGRESRLLRAHAAMAVAKGIDPEAALRAITRNAAEVAGVADRLGTIEVGKDADVALFAGEPLDPATPIMFVVSGGSKISVSNQPVAATKAFAAATAPAPAAFPGKFVLTSKNVLNEKGAFGPGRVSVDDGLFNGAKDSAGTPVIDVGDLYITPGLLSGPSSYGLASGGGDEAAAGAGALSAADAFDPEHKTFRDFKRGGFLHAIIAPPGNYVAPGVIAAASLGDPIAKAPDMGPFFSFTKASRNPERFPASLASQVTVAEKVLSDPTGPLSFQADIGANYYTRPQAPPEGASGPVAICVEAETRAEISAALDLAAATKRKLVLVEPKDFRTLLKDIKNADAAIVAAPVRKGDYDYSCTQLVAAAKAGVPIIFGGDSPVQIRLAAARCMGAGMSADAVMRAFTTDAVTVLGAPRHLGSFSSGASADFVLWDGPPWDLRRKPVAIIIRGELLGADAPAEPHAE